jgi:hypothetical protein
LGLIMVLEDHKRKKRRLLPPLLAEMGYRYAPYSWAWQLVPELFWLILLNERLGLRRGVEAATHLGKAASLTSKSDPKPLFAPLSSFSMLTDDEKQETLKALDKKMLATLREVLSPISAIWPESPISFLGMPANCDADAALAEISPVLEASYARGGRQATLAITTAVYLGLDQGRIKISREVFESLKTAFAEIGAYPETDESRSAGSYFRSMAPMFLLQDDPKHSPMWVETFWHAVSHLGRCMGEHQGVPGLPGEPEGIEGFIAVYSHLAQKDFRARQQALKLDLNNAQGQQVVLALLARQATLAIEIISSPGTWNPNVAPILLRAMADVHITLVWLLGDISKRVPMYVDDGMGAIKLEIAHRKAEAEASPLDVREESAAYTKYLEDWLESQRLEFLTEVNLGSWSGKSTRVMAEEIGCTDFYNYVFQPFSGAVHSYWSHVGRINVEYCMNPAHNMHFLPTIPQFTSDPHWCRMAAKYLNKTLDAFDTFIGRDDLPSEAYNEALGAFTRVKDGE